MLTKASRPTTDDKGIGRDCWWGAKRKGSMGVDKNGS